MNDQFYDVIDSGGNVVQTAEQQKAETAQSNVTELTPGLVKKWHKQNVTVKLPRVIGKGGCGHRLDLSRRPRHVNCESCLFAWFNNHGEIVQQLDEMHNNGNDAMIIELQGKKFFNQWLKFMATIAQWQLEQEINEQISKPSGGIGATGSVEGSQDGSEVVSD